MFFANAHVLRFLVAAYVTRTVMSALNRAEYPANGFTFTCTELLPSDAEDATTSDGGVINVMMLHGFPNSRFWFQPLLEQWESDDQNIHALACDLRGYSPGAKPESIEDYSDTKLFASDVNELANLVFGNNNSTTGSDASYHLIGHDHGAGLGWLMASLYPDQVLSYTAMSVPHMDQFSEALCGPNEDMAQVVASNYFNQWSDENAANDAMFSSVGESFLGFSNQNDMRLAMYWYYAFRPYVSLPRVVNSTEVELYASDNFTVPFINLVLNALPIEQRPCIPQKNPIGEIDMPVLFVCGSADTFLLCTQEQYVSPPANVLPNYLYYAAPCGHDFFLPEFCGDNATASTAVMNEITNFILGQNAATPDDGGSERGEEESSSSGAISMTQITAIWFLLYAFMLVY